MSVAFRPKSVLADRCDGRHMIRWLGYIYLRLVQNIKSNR